MLFQLHLRDCSPLPFTEVCTNPSTPPIGGAEHETRAAARLVLVAYRSRLRTGAARVLLHWRHHAVARGQNRA